MPSIPALAKKLPKVNFSKTALITSGTTSTEVDLDGMTVVGVLTPPSIASSTLTFTVSTASGGTFVPLKNTAGADFSVTVSGTTSQHWIDPAIFAGVKFVKVIAGSSETSKTFILVARSIE